MIQIVLDSKLNSAILMSAFHEITYFGLSKRQYILGRVGGQVVCRLPLYSDDPSSNPCEVYALNYVKFLEKNENKLKWPKDITFYYSKIVNLVSSTGIQTHALFLDEMSPTR